MSFANHIRSSIRQQRKSLSIIANRRHGQSVAARFDRLPQFRKARRIGIYLSVNGELDTAPLIDLARNRGIDLYLPVLHPFLHGHLLFCKWGRREKLVTNRFGIDEPCCRSSSLIDLRMLDLVVVPLVAFDASRNRIGMGGGYYDRTFGNIRRISAWRRPLLVGVAHAFQQVNAIDAASWDVPLDLVITESASF